MTPKRLWTTKFKEFDIVVAQTGEAAFKARAMDSHRNAVADADANDPHEAQARVLEEVRPYTAEFFGFDEAVNIFRKPFPDGFDDAYYEYRERGYKRRSHERALEVLNREDVTRLWQAGACNEIVQRVKTAYQAPAGNLLAPFEHAKLNDALKNERTRGEAARVIGEHLHADPPRFVERFAAVMRPHGAGTWPVATYLPFLLMPDSQMFLKPSVTQLFADRVGYDFTYDARPNVETYRDLLGLAALTVEALQVRSCPPTDRIDVQSFIWSIGHEGYIQDAITDRERKGFGSQRGNT